MKTTSMRWPLVVHSRPFVVMAALLCGLLTPAPGAGPIAAQAKKQATRPAPITPPSWFEKVPVDEKNVVARGRAEAKDQQLAIDRAVLAARGDIAGVLEGRWKELTVDVRREGFSTAEPAWEPFTLKKSTIKKQRAFRRGKTWTAFVLVSIPKTSIPALLLERARGNQGWYSTVKESRAIRKLDTPSR